MRYALILLLVVQDTPADLLKKDGWKAVRALVEKGAEARAGLEECARSEDGDVSFYAKAALAELDAGVGAKPPLRTKEIKESPAKEAVEALFAMMEQRFVAEGLPDKAVTIAGGLSIAEALDKLAADLGVEFSVGEDGFWHVGTAISKGPRFAFGQFRARLDAVRRQSQNEFDKPAVVGLQFSGFIEPDPTIRMTERNPNVKIVEAVDDTGANLKKTITFMDRFGRGFRSPREAALPFTVTVAAPDAKATKIARLRLSTEISVEKKRDTITFEKILEAKGTEKTAGQVTATIKDVSAAGEETKIELEINAKTNVEFPEWDTIKLTDSNGGEYQRGSSSSSRGGRKATYKFGYRNPGNLGQPSSFSFSMVTETAKRTLYFEFRDVPLK